MHRNFYGCNFILSNLLGVKGIPNEDSATGALLSTGIGIIGFAIAIWAGLNVSNIVNRKDIDEMQLELEQNKEELLESNDYIGELQFTIDELSETTKSEIKPFVKQSQEVLLQLFLVELERAQDDLIAQYFAKEFRDVIPNEKDIPYAKLIEIEMISAQVALRHRSAYAPDETLIELADKGIYKINQLSNCPPAEDYLTYRKADFMFYKGYCDKDKVESAKDFWEATKILIKELGDKSFTEKPGRLNSNHVLAYWNNMLGEAYSKIVHYYTDIYKKTDSLEEWKDTGIDVDYCIDKAICYCKKASALVERSVYWRNLGCAYERKDRVRALKENKEFVSENSGDIIEAFLHSVSKVINDYAIAYGTGLNAFSALLMYYQKYLNSKVGNLASEAEHISNMYAYASIAKQDFPRHMPFQKLYAFSCYYVFQALKLDMKIEAAHEKPLKYFKQQVGETISLLKSVDTEVGKKDPFTEKLSNMTMDS